MEEVVAGILIIIRAKFEKYKMFFINVYAPTNGTERVIFLNSIDTILQNCKTDEYVFLGGDFNCTENELLDRNHVEPHATSSRVLRKLIETHSLCDIWREFNGNVKQLVTHGYIQERTFFLWQDLTDSIVLNTM